MISSVSRRPAKDVAALPRYSECVDLSTRVLWLDLTVKLNLPFWERAELHPRRWLRRSFDCGGKSACWKQPIGRAWKSLTEKLDAAKRTLPDKIVWNYFIQLAKWATKSWAWLHKHDSIYEAWRQTLMHWHGLSPLSGCCCHFKDSRHLINTIRQCGPKKIVVIFTFHSELGDSSLKITTLTLFFLMQNWVKKRSFLSPQKRWQWW